MTRLALLVALLLFSIPASAEPVTRECDFSGRTHLGPLMVSVDEIARRVVVTTKFGLVSTYQDGAIGRLFGPDQGSNFGEVQQFVTIKPDRVEVGFRWPNDGLLGHWAYFDRAALHDAAAPCMWRSFWRFGVS